MHPYLLSFLVAVDNYLWGYIALPSLLLLGLYLTVKSRFIQLRQFPHIIKTFLGFFSSKREDLGVHPLKAFFTCMGGCMGIGNVVAICTAAQIGGPGALFWIWVTALLGMILKYSEVYLGVRYRIPDGKGSFRGGPMFYLQSVFKKSWIPRLVCLLLCIYGVEIYQFSVVTTNLASNTSINKLFIAIALIGLIIVISRKGVRQVGKVAAIFIPFFVVCYLLMAAWVVLQNLSVIPHVFHTIITSAFSGHAAVGAFAGSSILLTASQGIRRSCYAGDVGIGYASVIHSEASTTKPENQAALAVMEIFLDSFVICTTSVVLVLITGVWQEPMDASLLVQNALAHYFPGMHYFMPLFLLLFGFTTLVAYFTAGIKCAEHLSPTFGRKLFYFYAICALLAFTYTEPAHALTVMSITAAVLLMLNLYGIYRLRHEIGFELS